MILDPGLHEIPVEDYHLDPCGISLSHSGIVTLLNETPAHFAARHPKLSQWPDHIRESTKAQDLGSIVHSLILGKGAEYKVIDLSNFRNKDGSTAKTFGNAEAKRAKEEAEGNGFIVIDGETFMQAQAIAGSAIEALTKRFGGWPIGQSEVTGIWRRQTAHGEILCRMLMDHWSHRTVTILDVKTSGKSLGDEDLSRSMASMGNDIQAAFYLEGINTLFPELAGLTQFVFAYVETEPPYACRFVTIRESWLTRARFRVDRAANLFAECLKKDVWPAWSGDVALSAPGYLESKWEQEELQEVS